MKLFNQQEQIEIKETVDITDEGIKLPTEDILAELDEEYILEDDEDGMMIADEDEDDIDIQDTMDEFSEEFGAGSDEV